MMEWISVNDRLPENGQRVFVHSPETYYKTFEAQFNNGSFRIYSIIQDDYNSDWDCGPIAHWMPLPQPPKD